MNRLLHLKQEPRALLTAAGYQIDEMSESERCCGFGGLFSIRMPEVSNAMTADKLRQAQETEAVTLVTSDPGCLVQMRGLADDRLRIEHLAVMLDRAQDFGTASPRASRLWTEHIQGRIITCMLNPSKE